MDERTPTEHHYCRRRNRLSVVVLTAIVLIIAILSTPQSKSSDQSRGPRTRATAGNQSDGANTDSPAAGSGIAQSVLDAQPGLAHVTRDVDGDTIDVKLGGKTETIRFIGLDTPETHDPRKPVQCYGPEAAAHTKGLLEGKDVRLAADPKDSDRDKYGRLLRYVYLPDGTDVNAELVQDGWAFAYVIFPFSKHDDFVALESQAQAAGRGLWSACNVNATGEIKQTAGPKS